MERPKGRIEDGEQDPGRAEEDERVRVTGYRETISVVMAEANV